MPQCSECSYTFSEPPARLAERCSAFGADMIAVLRTTEPEVLLRRAEPGRWSPLEYAAHVGEAIRWYVARIRRVLREDVPQLTPFDWDRAAREGNYRGRGVDMVTSDLWQACGALEELASAVTAEDLVREGVGSDGTPRTVLALLARAGHELAHHELDIRRGLAAATTPGSRLGSPE